MRRISARPLLKRSGYREHTVLDKSLSRGRKLKLVGAPRYDDDDEAEKILKVLPLMVRVTATAKAKPWFSHRNGADSAINSKKR